MGTGALLGALDTLALALHDVQRGVAPLPHRVPAVLAALGRAAGQRGVAVAADEAAHRLSAPLALLPSATQDLAATAERQRYALLLAGGG